MPWIKPDSYGTPGHYSTPQWLYIPDDGQLEHARAERKRLGQHREALLAFQKASERQQDYRTARFFREEAADAMKEYRAYDAAIAWIEGKPGMDSWRHTMVSEQITPYVDAAFRAIDSVKP